MHELKITKFYPMDKQGNMLGFAAMQTHICLGNNLIIPVSIKVKVMRNSHNGHVFISMPSEKYIAKDGTEKYSILIYIEKEHNDIFQKCASKAWDEWVASTTPTASPNVVSPPREYYSHGIAVKTPQETKQERELPF